MGGYKITNLKQEVEDSAPASGLSPDLEARFARKALEGEGAGLSYQRLAPNFRIPFGHKHGDQEEIYVLLSGSAKLKLDDEVVEVQQWDAVRVDKDTMRNFEAGPEGAELLAFGAGAPGETEMVQNWWED
jgi:mannose-6-phosphate isomerase-like protein (cupin superfamily)